MSADPIEMMVVAGRPDTIAKQMAVVGGVPPYDYALVGAPAWARVSSTGYFSVIDVPVSAPPAYSQPRPARPAKRLLPKQMAHGA